MLQLLIADGLWRGYVCGTDPVVHRAQIMLVTRRLKIEFWPYDRSLSTYCSSVASLLVACLCKKRTMAASAASVPSWYSDTKVGRDTPLLDLFDRPIRRICFSGCPLPLQH